ncbi:hypothetical protein OXX80_003532 [Metschnikowia pulcherrima]|uniref:Uncharacterized protein n=2 Tax=Metschnikowia TaxID=27320 RepID=A0A4P6XJ44_9ASCO|nr:hypothetical protein HF325_002446 [Metschnikowia pulcherrima]QBM86096.1 hypothetical protein METSCH_A07310 [Metschnikowia aff. pulcherrima]
MNRLPQGSPFSHKVVVSTIAIGVGILGFWQTAKDFEFIKYEPRSPEEIEIRRRENIGLQIKHLETRTLDYTPEAKARLAQRFSELEQTDEEKK